MPTVGVGRDELFRRLGENFGSKSGVLDEKVDEKFDVECFNFGVELDDVTSEKAMKQKETGHVDVNASDEILYKIDVPANRYDLLCMEGIARAMSIFRGTAKVPQYVLKQPKTMEKMIIKKEVLAVRPHVVCAILRGIKFDERNYQSFIDLQEKLHQNICRRRTLASVGTHDLDTIKGPFTYEALSPKDIKFAPLNNKTVMNGEELMKHLDNDLHLKKYLSIIRDLPQYPVIYDANRVVLSLPPIINGDHSKITMKTKNVFIEVTGTDLTKSQITLNTICAMFSEYTSEPFTVEAVEVVEADGKSVITPDLTPKVFETNVDYVNRGLGLNIEPEKMTQLLYRMCLPSELAEDKRTLKVYAPITRTDILHPCDVLEDVGIAYGFNNLKIEPPPTNTNGKQQPLNKFTDLLRQQVAMIGFSEVLTFALCSREDNYNCLNRKDDNSAITIANPKTVEFCIARTTLLSGLFKTIASNKKHPLPIKIFEISDVVVKDDETDVGAFNKRNLSAVFCSNSAQFEVVHGLLDKIMKANSVQWKEQGKNVPKPYYELKPSEDPSFFPGMRANVYVNDEKIGLIGVVHPNVLSNFHIPYPCSALEICIEPFL